MRPVGNPGVEEGDGEGCSVEGWEVVVFQVLSGGEARGCRLAATW